MRGHFRKRGERWYFWAGPNEDLRGAKGDDGRSVPGRRVVAGHPGRAIALDPATVAVMRVHRKAHRTERLAWGPSWHDTGLVFTREDGTALRPETFSRQFEQHITLDTYSHVLPSIQQEAADTVAPLILGQD